jgi:hypothetical protein
MLFLLTVSILALVVLVFCWLVGDQHPATKSIFTLLYLGCFIPLYWGADYYWVSIVAQCVFIVIVGAATFGVEFLTMRK